MPASEARSHDPGLLTIAELAKRYDLPESTARYYCKRFLDFLPHSGHGKRRRYRPEAMDVFAIILPEMKKRKDAAAVEAVLEESFPRVAVDESDAASAPSHKGSGGAFAADVDGSAFMAAIERQNEALQGIASALARLASTQGEIKALKEPMRAVRGKAKRPAPLCAQRRPEMARSYLFSASLRFFAGLKRMTRLAGIRMVSPVWGLRPVRAARLVRLKVPTLGRRMP